MLKYDLNTIRQFCIFNFLFVYWTRINEKNRHTRPGYSANYKTPLFNLFSAIKDAPNSKIEFLLTKVWTQNLRVEKLKSSKSNPDLSSLGKYGF